MSGVASTTSVVLITFVTEIVIEKSAMYVWYKSSSCKTGLLIDTETRNFLMKDVLSGLRHFLATKNPLKIMKNAIISLQKPFSLSSYSNFCLDISVM